MKQLWDYLSPTHIIRLARNRKTEQKKTFLYVHICIHQNTEAVAVPRDVHVILLANFFCLLILRILILQIQIDLLYLKEIPQITW